MTRVLAIVAVLVVVVIIVGAFVLISKSIQGKKIAEIARRDPKQLAYTEVDPAVRKILIERWEWMEKTAKVLDQALEDPVVQSSLPGEYYNPLEQALKQYHRMEGN